MNSARRRTEGKSNSMKEKKLSKLIHEKSESDNESEHELSYYVNDRVKLMKEVLKIIKPKKIRSMAPQFMRNMDNEEINSMLLEELLGISNKRLKYIFNGQNLEEDSSSTDPEEDQKPIDVISLDDISDDALEDVIDLDSDKESRRRQCRKHRHKIKEEPRRKKLKKEKQDKADKDTLEKEKVDNPVNEQNLMSVLELLELQARARAIRSQLALESNKKQEERQKAKEKEATTQNHDDDDEDAVIIELPKNEEIVIMSSDSESENKEKDQMKNNEDNFWKGQKPTNGSFYANSECNVDVATIQNTDENDEHSSEKGQDKENSSKANSRLSDGRKAVIIQQVEIIRPTDCSDNVDPGHLGNIPLPVDGIEEMPSDKDGKNESIIENRTVSSENLGIISRVDDNTGTIANIDTNDEVRGNKQMGNTSSAGNQEDNISFKDSSQSIDTSKKDETTKDEEITSTLKKKHIKSDLKGDKIVNEKLEKDEEKSLRKKAVSEAPEGIYESNKTDELVSEETYQEKRPAPEDDKLNKKSEESLESKVNTDSKSQSFENPKKTKGKCKRRMAAMKADQKKSIDERTGDHSKLCEEKESNKKAKSDRKSTDDDKNNTDDSEGIVLHYDQADMECIIID